MDVDLLPIGLGLVFVGLGMIVPKLAGWLTAEAPDVRLRRLVDGRAAFARVTCVVETARWQGPIPVDGIATREGADLVFRPEHALPRRPSFSFPVGTQASDVSVGPSWAAAAPDGVVRIGGTFTSAGRRQWPVGLHMSRDDAEILGALATREVSEFSRLRLFWAFVPVWAVAGIGIGLLMSAVAGALWLGSEPRSLEAGTRPDADGRCVVDWVAADGVSHTATVHCAADTWVGDTVDVRLLGWPLAGEAIDTGWTRTAWFAPSGLILCSALLGAANAWIMLHREPERQGSLRAAEVAPSAPAKEPTMLEHGDDPELSQPEPDQVPGQNRRTAGDPGYASQVGSSPGRLGVVSPRWRWLVAGLVAAGIGGIFLLTDGPAWWSFRAGTVSSTSGVVTRVTDVRPWPLFPVSVAVRLDDAPAHGEITLDAADPPTVGDRVLVEKSRGGQHRLAGDAGVARGALVGAVVFVGGVGCLAAGLWMRLVERRRHRRAVAAESRDGSTR